MVFTVALLALYLGAPPALEAPKVLIWSACLLLLAPLPLDMGSPGSFKGLMVPKGAPLALRAPHML